MKLHIRGTRTLAFGLVALIAGVLEAPAVADQQAGHLPGGASIAVAIDSPADGSVLPGPSADVPVTGTAAVGQGVAFPNTALVYALDVSGSTDFDSIPGCGGDQNGDGNADRILDCEIAAARALNQDAVAKGTVGEAGIVVWADLGASGDVGPDDGDQVMTGPSTDADGMNGPDVDEVLTSVFSGGAAGGRVERFTPKHVSSSTNFEAGVQKACEVASVATKPNRVVVFMSDGFSSTGGNAVDDLPCAIPATFHTFAVGEGSNCDFDAGERGSLRAIAEATGGTCTHVVDVGQLPVVVPTVIASRLTALTMTVNGEAPQDISATASPSLPQTGPASVTYGPIDVNGLTPGVHTICVTAHGSDGGGEGSVTDCHTITVEEETPSDPGCTRTVGYWSTHSEYGPASYDDTWAALPQGADTPFFATGQSYYEVLRTFPGGNGYYVLAHQYIAAQVNELAGADRSAVQSEFDQATDLLEAYTPEQVGAMRGSDPVRQRFIGLADALDDYNNGLTGPGHCVDGSLQE